MNEAESNDIRRVAGWLPSQDDLEAWIAELTSLVDTVGQRAEWAPSVARLAQLVDSDPVLRMYAERMVAETPSHKPYAQRHLRDLPHLFALMSAVLSTAPEFSPDAMIMTPLGAVLDWPVGTTAGFAFFRDPRINAALADVLSEWCEFLSGPDSRYVLNCGSTGWLGSEARDAIGLEEFAFDPDEQYGGFSSWNDFFTRRFAEGRRPVAAPEDDFVIVSACESTPCAINRNVREQDRFWVKDQSYSLHDLLAGDETVEQFVGGTVYQAYLSATNYHRWHAPVSGTVRRSYVVPGTYYSEADTEGREAVEPQQSQGYLAHVATRAVIVIEADEPSIGPVAFVPVGMSDVSSCVIGPDAAVGRHVTKGDELGYFQFGGSTHCLVFRPGVIADFAFAAIPQTHDPAAPLVPVRSAIATSCRPATA